MARADVPPAIEQRVARFAGRLERTSLDELRLLAARPDDPTAHREAVDRARLEAAMNGREAAVDRARRNLEDWVLRIYNERQYQATLMGSNWDRSLGPARDRAEIAAALRDAFMAVVLWDLLSEEDRDELLGPWGRLAS